MRLPTDTNLYWSNPNTLTAYHVNIAQQLQYYLKTHT